MFFCSPEHFTFLRYEVLSWSWRYDTRYQSPWFHVPPVMGCDLDHPVCTCQRNDYLITVDHYGDYWEIDCITGDTRSEVIVELTKQHFARHGMPDTVITDNGPQFIAHEYHTFAREWEFNHTTSSPHHSQSNSKAERPLWKSPRNS